MPPRSDTRRFVQDLILLLGLPAVVVAAIVIWQRPWEQLPYRTHPVSEPAIEARSALTRRARREGGRQAPWHGFWVEVPPAYVLTVREPTLELLEQDPPAETDNQHWPAQMAFLDLDSAAVTRFADAEANCSLAPGRCWSDLETGHVLHCQRSAGVTDPAVPWTPHLECQVPELSVRVLINANPTESEELLALFKRAIQHPLVRTPN